MWIQWAAKGLLYKDEVYDDAIRTGDRMRGYIKTFVLI
jgi:hypothetical protein